MSKITGLWQREIGFRIMRQQEKRKNNQNLASSQKAHDMDRRLHTKIPIFQEVEEEMILKMIMSFFLQFTTSPGFTLHINVTFGYFVEKHSRCSSYSIYPCQKQHFWSIQSYIKKSTSEEDSWPWEQTYLDDLRGTHIP